MHIKIFFEGLELHVPPEEVANVVQQLKATKPFPGTRGQSVPTQPSATSTTQRRIDADVDDLIGELPLGKTSLDPKAAWPFPTKGAKVGVKHEDFMMALAFLDAIQARAHRKERLDGDAVGAVLGVKHPKGIGSKAATINKLLVVLGFEPGDVYKVPRDGMGSRYWIPGPKLDAAFSAIEREIFETVAK